MTYSQNPLYNFLQVQIPVNSLTNKYYFPDLPQLREAKICAITFYPKLSAVQYATDINNVGSVLILDCKASYLTLNSGAFNVVEKMPLLKLKNVWYDDPLNPGQNYPAIFNNEGILAFDGKVIDFSKSFVEVAPNYAFTTPTPFTFSFGIWYKK